MKKRQTVKWLSALFLFMILGMAFPLTAHAFEQKAKTGEWITLRPDEGNTRGKVNFWLKAQSDVNVSIKDVKVA